MAIVTRAGKGEALSFDDGDNNLTELDLRTKLGWKDLTAPISNLGVPVEFAPVYELFGPSGNRREAKFDIGDYVYIQAFHVNHDMKVGGLAYPHVHWSTDGTSTATVKWEFEITRAKGHNQEFFGAGLTTTVEQAANGGAWRHMVAEVSTPNALTLNEPDELILVTLKRVTNGGTDNPDKVYALAVDLHYEADRSATPNKAPNFYS